MALIGGTFGRYFAARSFKAMAGVFLTVCVLIYTVDFVELMRRASEAPTAGALTMAKLALFRTPSVTEQVLPFAVLFGAMAAMLNLSRKLELVVTRSAGVSVWQFLQPPILVALLIGVFMVGVYNPLSATLKQRATEIEAVIFGKGARALGQETWIRQKSPDGQAIIRAMAANSDGTTLTEVTAFVFSTDGSFLERVEAKQATLKDRFWEMSDVRIVSADNPPATHATYKLATNLKAEQVRQSFVPPASVPFWSLPTLIEQTRQAGLDANRYELQYQTLLAKPLLLVAMVIIASTVSLRFFRMGGVARMVLGGVSAGFVLYVVRQLVEDLGANGLLSVTAAAWTPAAVAALTGAFILLHLEDG
ncbi:MAG: LPS export ABC transporter permease LptG [Rhizobiales bacterium 65-9]|nr:LPS export ABC transporter permease LptG [Hyphomicrobiales bacterium]OJY37643.1 MAG: LPS export ABC transporter permease LptG [Rhizobiales bacterium 65-9]